MSRLPNDTLRKTLEDIRIMVASNTPRSADSESSGPMSLPVAAVPQSIGPAPSLDVTRQQQPVVTVEAQQEAPEVVSFRVPWPRYKSADLSRKVSRVSKRVVIEGSLLVFYLGEWTSDGDRVRTLLVACRPIRNRSDTGRTWLPEGPIPGFSNGKLNNCMMLLPSNPIQVFV
ncbi:hypothetical protein BC827DRAFT_383414 [Russula dissimulans]|nr:hypothetical protein BC827DRAFT_383414 [Russula dissimulans]